MEFAVNDASFCLEAQVSGQALPLIAPVLPSVSQRDQVLGYLRGVADQLNELHSAGHIDKMAALLSKADRHLHQDRLANYAREFVAYAEPLG